MSAVIVMEVCPSCSDTFLSRRPGQGEAGGGVPQVVQPDRRQPGVAGQPLELPVTWSGWSGCRPRRVNTSPVSAQAVPQGAAVRGLPLPVGRRRRRRHLC